MMQCHLRQLHSQQSEIELKSTDAICKDQHCICQLYATAAMHVTLEAGVQSVT